MKVLVAISTLVLSACVTQSADMTYSGSNGAKVPAISLPPEMPSETDVTLNSDERPIAKGIADISRLQPTQISAMFTSAIQLASPSPEKKAICVGMRGKSDREMADPPASVINQISKIWTIPVVYASECSFGRTPFVTTSRLEAILYSVTVTEINKDGSVKYWANALYANLGANGQEYLLERQAGRWVSVPTGVMVIS